MVLKEVCAKLREKRRELNISMEEAVEATKISPGVIRDIESCNVGKLGPTYLKGFLKIYAAYLKVDVSEPIDDFNWKFPGAAVKPAPVRPSQKSAETRAPARPAAKETSRRPLIPFQVIQALVFVAVSVAALWALFGLTRFIARTTKKFVATHMSRSSEPKSVAGQSVAQEPGSGAPPARLEKKPAGNRLLSVSVRAKRACYIRAKVDFKTIFDGTLKKGAVESWRGKQEIVLRIQDGSAVYIEVNGEPLRAALTSLPKPIKGLKVTSAGVMVDK